MRHITNVATAMCCDLCTQAPEDARITTYAHWRCGHLLSDQKVIDDFAGMKFGPDDGFNRSVQVLHRRWCDACIAYRKKMLFQNYEEYQIHGETSPAQHLQLAWSYGVRDGRMQAQHIDLEGQVLDVAKVILREPNLYEPSGKSLSMDRNKGKANMFPEIFGGSSVANPLMDCLVESLRDTAISKSDFAPETIEELRGLMQGVSLDDDRMSTCSELAVKYSEGKMEGLDFQWRLEKGIMYEVASSKIDEAMADALTVKMPHE
jgi:hypothetical protein